jgi:carboxypeptidase C (cathepsin A)
MKPILNSLVLLLFLLLVSKTNAQTITADSNKIPVAVKSVTKHSAVIGGKVINYTATAGALILLNDKEEPIAFYGYTAYVKDGEPDGVKRPLTFSYNGGPGSSSMWLHLGIMGPKRVVVNDPEIGMMPPYKMEDNSNSILDVSDVVMIDPVGTGISHPIGKAKGKDFWGVDQDIKTISQFIKQYITDNARWNSPKFLLGESYGTMRSAGVADYLQENMGISVNGVILVSSVLDLRTLTFQQGDDISFVMHLPTYAATAWYHNKITDKSSGFESFLKEARAFSAGEYSTALIKGSRISDEEKNKVATKLSSFTGLSKEYIAKANLRVSEPQFTQELLRDQHLSVGRLDARYKGINQNLLSEFSTFDPQSTAISPSYISMFLNYYYEELKVDKSHVYHVSAYDAEGFNWDWKHKRGAGVWDDPVMPNTAVDLAEAMSHNPKLKILTLNGYYDLATPFYGTEYTFDHMGLEKQILQNVSFKYYEAGHMMYIQPASASLFKKDVAAFILDALTK